MRRLIAAIYLLGASAAFAGAQQYEPLSASVRGALHKAVSDSRPAVSSFRNSIDAVDWLGEMSRRLEKRIPNREYRIDLLRSVHYEATRAGLDPQLVLGLMQVESGFRKYAVSSAGARGYMQVMPFWVKLIGRPEDSLFDLRTSLRYGCTILRHYRQPGQTGISQHGPCRLAKSVGLRKNYPAQPSRAVTHGAVSAPCPGSCLSCRASACRYRPWKTASSFSASVRIG